jgi:(Z)-2-((N-methylformamido)methylene)-5-hydroxybutyrolactone dehydrogenase
MKSYNHWIDGTWVEPASKAWLESDDPYRGESWAKIARGSAADGDRAVEAARNAMTVGQWASMSATARGKVLRRIGDILLENLEPLAICEVRDNGKLLAEVRGQLRHAAEVWYYFAGLADKIEGAVMPVEKQDVLGLTFHEPVGVVLALTAWNSPLNFFALKCAPALAAGCAVVLKPSEFSSVSSLEFAALLGIAGLPHGVINVVTGLGAEIGAPLVEHPKIAHISFTGSDVTGTRIYEAAARQMKRVHLELGGKSPNIVFEDCDMDAAVAGAVSGVFGAAGQMCTAGSRLLVQNSIKDDFENRLVMAARAVRLGNPMDPDTQMGPISTTPQFEKVLRYLDIARADGARCIAGGKQAVGADITAQFVEATVFTDVTNSMRIAREEVFGPVLAVIGFEDESDAIRIANDTDYGLAAGIWTADIGRMIRVAKALEVGTVWGNMYRTYSITLPFGGRKKSGLGRESGIESVHEFLETKSLMLATGAAKPANNFLPR